MDKQTENTKFIIQRFDNYISAANVKGNFLLAFNTFLTGGVLANYSKIQILIKYDCALILFDITFFILIFLSLIITFFIIKAVYPYLLSGNSTFKNYHSHLFFNSVSEFENENSYHESLSKLHNKEFDKDLSYQAYTLSKGLKIKYENLKWATRFVYFELLCILIILLIILFNANI